MGECAYSLKAMFKNVAAAEAACEPLDNFFKEIMEASQDTDFRPRLKACAKKYPLAVEYIKTLDAWADKTDPHPESLYFDVGSDTDNSVEGYENVLCWSDACVGHMTSWTPLAKFIKTKFNAVRVVWCSEENANVSLELYDWEKIVTDLLKQKALLPLMLRVNDELDELISLKLEET
jgi:hypothetical protein